MGNFRVVERDMVDAAGAAIEIRGTNWFGFETPLLAPGGLHAAAWSEHLDRMQELGVNALRIPICPETLRPETQPTEVNYTINPELRSASSLDLLDRLVADLDERSMYALVDHHRPDTVAISELWYTDAYPETQWIADLCLVAARYQDVAHFLGVDLKNEPHGRASWGFGAAASDWNSAAERAAAAILDVAPSTLLFVEGIANDPFGHNREPHWWGGNFEPMRRTPLAIPSDRLVLSPHVYGPDVYPQPYFADPRFPRNLPRIWDAHFGRFAADHCMVIGEWGGQMGRRDPKDEAWHRAVAGYFAERDLRHHFYWCWNPDSEDTGGLLEDDWKTPRPDKRWIYA